MATRGEFGVRYSTLTDSVGQSSMDREQPFAVPGANAGLTYEELNNRVSTSVTQIGSNVATLQRLAKQFGRSIPSKRLREELATVQKATTELIKSTNENMHRLEGIPVKGMSSTHQRRHLLDLERLRNSFKEVLSKYNAVTKTIIDKEKESVEEARRNVSLTRGGLDNDDDDEDVEFSLEDERLLQGRQPALARQEPVETEADLCAIREREEALRALEHDILDVNDIFRDISQMVHDQGFAIDTIENNIDTAALDVEGATNEIAVASRFQKKARGKKCVVVGVLLGVVAVVTLIIVLSTVHSK